MTVPEGEKLKQSLEIILFIHIFVAISKIIILGFGFGLGDAIQCLILSCGVFGHNFCNVYIYMLFTLVLALQLLAVVGFAI